MINKKILILVFGILLSSYFTVYAENIFQGKQSDEPMEITSDRMEAFNEKKLVVFSGHATVTQGKNILKSDKLLLYYKTETDSKEKIGSIETEKAGELERIEAQGNVSFTQGSRTARSDEAVYYRDTHKIVMTGNALLNEGKNFIKGDRVIVYLNENKGVVESSTQKQVKAIIYPQDTKKAGTK